MKKRSMVLAAVLAAMAVSAAGTVSFAEETEKVTEQTAQTAEAKETEQEADLSETEEPAAGGSDLVAGADEMAAPVEVVDADMEPIYAEDIEEGTYAIEVSSSSSMFKITDCRLTVADGGMSAVITLGGTGYLKLFMGTGEEAVQASEDAYLTFTENEEGMQMYEVPVEALNKGIHCAAWSKRKEKWYDRVLVFEAASLPQGALKNVEMTTLEELSLADGTYQVEVGLAGGSGRTKVQSPTTLTVADGVMTAEIVWSSPYYDYMRIGGEKYFPVNTEGNSVFEIPVDGMDYDMMVTADTVAMSEPHEIDYTIHFDSASLKEAE